jgi:hypothetical protein
MSSTVATARQVSHRDSLADVRPTPVKAELKPQVTASDLPGLTGRAIRKAHGKMQTAGGVLGMSESQIGRLVNDEDLKLKHLAALGPATLAALGHELVETYAPLDTPLVRAHRLLREAHAALDELEQALELIA